MPRLDRAGLKFGHLTVIEDSPASDKLRCVCRCGRESLYPRTISKPTYKGRLMCAWCAGSPCVICGEMIPAKPGHPAATCSSACAAEHIKRRGQAWYQRVKGTDHWRAVRAAYLQHIRQRMTDDPSYAHQRRLAAAQAHQRFKSRQSPADRAARQEKHRLAARRALEAIRAAGNYPEYLARHRRWYASLSDEDYQRIYRRKRSKIRPRKADQRHASTAASSSRS